MENNLSILLKEYGLNEQETRVYAFLVGNKELTAYKIAKELKIHKSTCYDILEKLTSKGFVNKLEKNKSYFEAGNISRLISNLKVKENILLEVGRRIKDSEKRGKTKVRYIEGIEGQNEFNLKMFNLAKERKVKYCYIIGNTYAATEGSNILIDKLINLLKKNKKIGDYRGIWSLKYKTDKIIEEYNSIGENKFLDIPSKVGMVVYEKGVAFLYTSDNSYTIDIENEVLAEEMKAYFEYLWKIARK